jgi:hypothetical protein
VNSDCEFSEISDVISALGGLVGHIGCLALISYVSPFSLASPDLLDREFVWTFLALSRRMRAQVLGGFDEGLC